MSFQKIKGTLDYFGLQTKKRRYVESVARNICKLNNIEEIITPTIEYTDVFVRSSGDSSDIVTKEMYTFKDKGDRSITLRPEGTAGVCRAFLEEKLYVATGLKKYFYNGSMFRCERPQAGRYREFNQFGVEYYGEDSYLVDASVIILADSILKSLGLSNNYKVCVNTIGDFKSRMAYQEALRKYFSENIDSLCEDCKNRLNKNPLRILDCKVDKDSEVLKNAPKIVDYLTKEAKEYFDNLLKTLDYMNINYYVDNNLVRGLDYYTDTVFEFIACNDDSNESLNGLAILAGGKYSDLVKEFGGPSISGIGFAFGVERVISLMDKLNLFPESINDRIDYVVIGLDPNTKLYTLEICETLRKLGYSCEMDYKNCSFKPQFKLVDRVNPKYILIFGEEEVKENKVTIKNNDTKEQITLNIDEFIESLK